MTQGQPSVLIRNGLLVTATEQVEADVYIEGERIIAIGKDLPQQSDQVLDAAGRYVFPGGIDAHTHMELPFMGTFSSDTFETGTRAGLHGGTTTIIDFAIQTQGKSLQDAFDTWQQKAGGHAVGDYAFHLGVTDFNPSTQAEISQIIQQGVTSFKVFMAYKGALMIDDRQLFALMNTVKTHGGLVTAHTENGDMIDELIAENLRQGNTEPRYHPLSRPDIAEAEAAGRFLDLAHYVGRPVYIVHLTCDAALNRVRESLRRGQRTFVETCIQYLLLEDSLYSRPGFEGAKWVFSPPLRKPQDQDALWDGLKQGLIQVVATDHCPFCMEQKAMGIDNFSKIPNGAPGVEHRMELLFSEGVLKNRLTLQQFVDVTATQPARIFGLAPRKGSIAVGGDADLVIFNPETRHTISAATHHHQCDYSAYEGWSVTGKAETVLLRGQVVVDKGKTLVQKGYGKYIPRKTENMMVNQ